MKYTKKQFEAEYPNDDACLDAVFQNRFGDLKFCPKCGAETRFYRVKKRQCYACMHCGYQLHPLADTIFRKTTTPLTDWFYAIYLFSTHKNGISAKTLERELGVTYKTAWRMANHIRKLMEQDTEKLSGTVQADETFYGGKYRNKHYGHGKRYPKFDNKTPIMGAVENDGVARAVVTDWASTARAKEFLLANLETGSELHTDESRIYTWAKGEYEHKFVNHHKEEYVKKGVHTNTIEGFWGQLKRSINGTYHVVSPKYLQSYVNEFVFRYNFRDVAVCPVLLERASRPFQSDA